MIYTKAAIEKGSGQADFVAVASTAVEDRHGEIVEVEGWDLKNFKKNPVLLWAHDHSQLAVGKATKTWIEGSGKRAKLMIEGVINEATDLSRAVKFLVKDGTISTVSVGFRGLEGEDNRFTKQELLEVSFVNVPANQQAMITAYKSLKKADFENKTISDLGIPTDLMEELEKLDKRVKSLEAKEESTSASQGRHPSQAEKRQVLVKAIERSAQQLAKQRRAKEISAIKLAVDRLSLMNKEEINGTNSRTS